MEKALHELPLEDSVIDFFKQISGSGPSATKLSRIQELALARLTLTRDTALP